MKYGKDIKNSHNVFDLCFYVLQYCLFYKFTKSYLTIFKKSQSKLYQTRMPFYNKCVSITKKGENFSKGPYVSKNKLFQNIFSNQTMES